MTYFYNYHQNCSSCEKDGTPGKVVLFRTDLQQTYDWIEAGSTVPVNSRVGIRLTTGCSTHFGSYGKLWADCPGECWRFHIKDNGKNEPQIINFSEDSRFESKNITDKNRSTTRYARHILNIEADDEEDRKNHNGMHAIYLVLGGPDIDRYPTIDELRDLPPVGKKDNKIICSNGCMVYVMYFNVKFP